MMTKSIFATSIDDMMQRTKFFECFVCLQQFNQLKNFPMEICERQHYMCHECVESNMFKKNAHGNGFVCNLCSLSVEKTRIRRSPFLLSIKDFVEELVQREKVRKEKYKECMERQAQLTEELMNENIMQRQRIEQLENQVRYQEQMLLGVLEQSWENKVTLNKKQYGEIEQNNTFPKHLLTSRIGLSQQKTAQNMILPKHLLTSKIGLNAQEAQVKKDKTPETFRSMFREIQLMKASIQQNENMDKEEYRKRIDQLQKHESYLYQILQKQDHP